MFQTECDNYVSTDSSLLLSQSVVVSCWAASRGTWLCWIWTRKHTHTWNRSAAKPLEARRRSLSPLHILPEGSTGQLAQRTHAYMHTIAEAHGRLKRTHSWWPVVPSCRGRRGPSEQMCISRARPLNPVRQLHPRKERSLTNQFLPD